ncbi:MAG: carbohydrate porin [Pseudomonadota bacterium]
MFKRISGLRLKASALAIAGLGSLCALPAAAMDTQPTSALDNVNTDNAANDAVSTDQIIAANLSLPADRPALQTVAAVSTPEAEPQPQGQSAQPPAAPPQRPEPDLVKLVVSQFVDVPVAGSAPGTFRYSGRADAYITLPGSRWGADDSWQISVRPEITWGETSNGEIGLIPGNTALFRPEGSEDYDVSLSVKKTWKSGTSLEVGKINVLDISGALPIVGSNGHFGFQNLGIALPPTAVVPNTLTGAALQIPTKKVIYRLWVFDPDSQYNRTGFETAFESGVAFLGSAAFRTSFGQKPGLFNFAVVGSTRSGPAFDILPRALTPPPPPIGNFGNEEGELALQLSGFQYLKLNPRARGKGLGVFARFQASMGDPTFLDYSGFVGIAGNPAKRPQDRFGLAAFFYSLTDELVDDIAFRLPIEDERGVEAFYTVGFAKGWEMTANVQVVDSAIAFRDTGVTLGARLTATF